MPYLLHFKFLMLCAVGLGMQKSAERVWFFHLELLLAVQ